MLDSDKSVIEWNSESIKIKYLSPVDGKFHVYHPDCFVKKIVNGVEKKLLIEVKATAFITHPKKPSTVTLKTRRSYLIKLKFYAVNMAKIKAAKEWCERSGVEFVILQDNFFKRAKLIG